MLCGEAACVTSPMNGCGVGSAMISAKLAAEVITKALLRKETSIDRLWEYQVRFMEERGRNLAALDAMRRGFQKFTHEESSFLLKKGIISKADLEGIIHVKYKKISIFKMAISLFKGISNIGIMLRMRKIIAASNKIFKHYKRMPKEYDSRKYYEWMLGHMYLFNEIEQNS